MDQELAELTAKVRRMAQLHGQQVAQLGSHHALSQRCKTLSYVTSASAGVR